MKAQDLGVSTGEEETTPAAGGEGSENAGQNSERGGGTGDTTTPNAESGGEGDGSGVEGDGASGEGEGGDPKDKRINDLMSKWQGEEHDHGQTKATLDAYKAKYGELPEDGNASINQPVRPSTDQTDPNLPAALKPDWKPVSMKEFQGGLKELYEDAAAKGEQRALDKIEKAKQAGQQAQQQVTDFVTEVKTADPSFDEKAFFAYANKYSFKLESVQDLRNVFINYKDFHKDIQNAKAEGADNRNKRKDPVNRPGSGSGESGGVPFSTIRKAGSSKELVQDHLRKQAGNK